MRPLSASSLSRRYTLLIAACALPLLLLVGILGAYQFEAQRRSELETFAAAVSETKLMIEGVVQDASDHLIQLKFQAESLLSGAASSTGLDVDTILVASHPRGKLDVSDGLTLDGLQSEDVKSRFGNAFVAQDRLAAAAPGELDMALALFEPMRLTHLVKRNLRWSYYFSASGAFITMYPFVSRAALVDGFHHASIGAMIDHYLTYDVYLDAAPARNQKLSARWTAPYFDAAGAGWMVSHSAPVILGDRFVGVVGTDLLLAYLDELLIRAPLKAGQLWIVNPAGELIADRAGTPPAATGPRHIREVAPRAIGNADVLAQTIIEPGRHRVAGHHIVAAAIAGTPWTLVSIVADEELTGVIRGQILPYGVILIGLLATILAAHHLLRLQFVRPAIWLTQHLGAESEGVTSRPAVPSFWLPWFDRISAVFAQNRETMSKLIGSEQRYRNVIETQTDFVIRMTPDGRFNFVNEAYCRYTQKTREELLDAGYSDFDGMHPEVRVEYLAHLAKLTPENPIATIELRRFLPDGAVRWAAWNDHGFFDTDGRLIEIQSVGRDITEQRRAAMALAASEERFRSVVEAITDLVIRFTRDGRLTFVNDAFCRHMGKNRDELLSPDWSMFELLPPEERERQERYFATLTPDNPIGVIELRSTQLDGSSVYREWTDHALFDASGSLIEIQAVGRDVTEKRLALNALAESEQRYRSVVEAQTEFVVRMTPDGRLSFVNDAYCGYHGRSREELLNPQWCEYDVLSAAEKSRFLEHLARLTPESPVASIELRNELPGFPTRWSAWVDRGIFDENGRLVEVQSVGRDITERVIAEQARQETERLRKTALEAALDGYMAVDRDGLIIELNPAAEAIFGYRREQVLGKPLAAIVVPPELREKHQEGFRRHLATGEAKILGRRIEVPAQRADGSAFPIELVIVRGTVAEKPVFIAYLRDLTEQKRAAAALSEREAQFRAIAEGVPLSIVISAIDEPEVFFVNERTTQALGLEVGQKTDRVLAVWKNPSDRIGLARRLKAEGVVDAFETTFIQSDGREMQALVSARHIDYQGEPAVLAAITDITRQREAEAEIAIQREALHQSEKLTALGSLLAGVAHELNNPLSVVVGYSSMLKELSHDPAITSRAERIHSAAERCSRIVRTFLSMARKRPPSRGVVGVNGVVTAALELAGYGLRSAGIQLDTVLADGLPAVWADEDQLHQVVTNLIINAQQALVTVEQPRRLSVSTRTAGSMVEIEVTDSGPGIPDEVRTRIFEPFFTTKAAGVGTGVGLSVCRSIVRAHDGEIIVESNPGAGTSIVVRIPLAQTQPDAQDDSADQANERPAFSANVLVIDDEPDIAAMVAEMLRQDGHVAVIAKDAASALNLIQQADVDVIISDLRMPGLDGPGLYRAIEENRPDLLNRLLFITGDVLAGDIDRFLAETNAAVMEKPLDRAAFRRAVASRLTDGKGETE